MEAYLDYLKREQNRSQLTVGTYRNDLEDLFCFLRERAEGVGVENVTPRVARQWVATLTDKGFAAASVNRKLSVARSFYRFLMMRQIVQANPFYGVRSIKTPARLPKFVRPKEMDRLLDSMGGGQSFAEVRDAAVIMVLYHTGVRRAELIGLNDEGVDLGRCVLRVMGKGNKQRDIPFGPELKEVLLAYLEKRRQEVQRSTSAFFVTDRGKRMSATGLYRLVKAVLSGVTSLSKKSPHVLRHSFASAMLNNNADIGSIRALLGHESVKTTEIYTHTTFEELKKAYKQAHPRA